MQTITTDINEIIKTLVERVKSLSPDVSILKGSPVYDLIVNTFAGVIQEEREIINVITNIARVAPMFDDAGNLLSEYAAYTDALTERFFLATPEEAQVWDTVYLVFNQRDNIIIENGATIFFGDVELKVLAEGITRESSQWRINKGRHMHPVNISGNTDIDIFIPASEMWSTGFIDYRSDLPDTSLIGAITLKSVNTISQPPITLNFIRDSISNRSLSSVRSLKFNLKTNSVFSPEEMKQVRVMHVTEPEFIERRKALYHDEDKVLSTVVSGDGKILVDYGNELQMAEVMLEYIQETDPVYPELANPVLLKNPGQALQWHSLVGVNYINSAEGLLYGRLKYETYDDSVLKLTFTLYKDASESSAVAYGELTLATLPDTDDGYRYARLTLTQKNYSGINGTIGLVVDLDLLDSIAEESFVFKTDTFGLYRIKTQGLGLLTPVAIGDEATITDLMDKFNSFDPSDILPPFTKASASYPSTDIIVRGDQFSNIESITMTALDASAAAVVWSGLERGELYWRLYPINGGADKIFALSFDKTFKNKAKQIAVLKIDDTYTAHSSLEMSTIRNSFIKISVKFNKDAADLMEDIDWDNYLVATSSFIRVSNTEIIMRSKVEGAAVNLMDNKQIFLLYYGTNKDRLETTQRMLINPAFTEIGSRIIAYPYRPIVFTCYYSPEYIYPYIENKDYSSYPDGEKFTERLDTRMSQYIELLKYLEEFFSNYSGKISDIDFSELAKNAEVAAGITFKKLDYAVYTQRGYVVRGIVHTDLDYKISINWKELTKQIAEEVDGITQVNSAYIPVHERESQITDETMYKPVFSKVAI